MHDNIVKTILIEPRPTPRVRGRLAKRKGTIGNKLKDYFVIFYNPKSYDDYLKRIANEIETPYLWDMEQLYKLNVIFYIGASESWTKLKKQAKLNQWHDNKNCDTDNYAKGLMDAMTGVFYNDDSQVVELHVRKIWTSEGQGRIWFRLSPADLEDIPWRCTCCEKDKPRSEFINGVQHCAACRLEEHKNQALEQQKSRIENISTLKDAKSNT